MSTDDRLNRHLAAQARAISLAPADPAEIRRRGASRRGRRRVAVVACAAVLGVVATSVATIDDGGRDTSIASDSGTASVVPSSYDWTVVTPVRGLGYSRSQVHLASGAVYGLSTAPGAAGEDAHSEPPQLYRSDDGAEWATVELPDGFSPSYLAASGDTLYAIGTAPAGGDARKLVVAASDDGAGSWSELALPAEVEELDARYPGQISISQPTVAALDATHLVASVVVTTVVDVSRIPGSEGDITWEYTDDGIVVSPAGECPGPEAERGWACHDAAAPSTTSVGADGEANTGTVRQAEGAPGQARTYTWDELGVPAELRDHVHGRTYVYASADGSTFEPVTLPGGDLRGWGAEIVATEAGYHLFAGGSSDGAAPTTTVLRSADGFTWEPAGELAGSPQAAGVLAGQPAVTVFGAEGTTAVHVGRDDGSWAPVDLGALLDGSDGAGVYEVAFGPLGMAAVVGTTDGGDGAPELHLLHTADGVTFSRLEVQEAAGDPVGISSGVSVTADAIVLRLAEPSDGDDDTPPVQRVLVGTPTS